MVIHINSMYENATKDVFILLNVMVYCIELYYQNEWNDLSTEVLVPNKTINEP